MSSLAMRSRLTLFLALLNICCASSTVVNAIEPEIQVAQMPASEFIVKQQGAVSIGYEMKVRNQSTVPITLRKLEMRTVGRSPYVLRRTPVSFDETIEAGKEAVVTFSMWAYSEEGRSKPAERVWVSGIAYFETANGTFRKEFSQSFTQPE